MRLTGSHRQAAPAPAPNGSPVNFNCSAMFNWIEIARPQSVRGRIPTNRCTCRPAFRNARPPENRAVHAQRHLPVVIVHLARVSPQDGRWPDRKPYPADSRNRSTRRFRHVCFTLRASRAGQGTGCPRPARSDPLFLAGSTRSSDQRPNDRRETTGSGRRASALDDQRHRYPRPACSS